MGVELPAILCCGDVNGKGECDLSMMWADPNGHTYNRKTDVDHLSITASGVYDW
jgi:hypothetical protein